MPLCGSQNCGCAISSNDLTISGSGTGPDPWVIDFATLAPFDWSYRFASAAARDAAIISPTEGMIAYLTDTNTVWRYTGSSWQLEWAADQWLDTSFGSGSSINAPATPEAAWISTSITVPIWATGVVVQTSLTHIKTTALSAAGYALRHSLGGVNATNRVIGDHLGTKSEEYVWHSAMSGISTGSQTLTIKAERLSGTDTWRFEANNSRCFVRIRFTA